jgi:hypothetical protein
VVFVNPKVHLTRNTFYVATGTYVAIAYLVSRLTRSGMGFLCTKLSTDAHSLHHLLQCAADNQKLPKYVSIIDINFIDLHKGRNSLRKLDVPDPK